MAAQIRADPEPASKEESGDKKEGGDKKKEEGDKKKEGGDKQDGEKKDGDKAAGKKEGEEKKDGKEGKEEKAEGAEGEKKEGGEDKAKKNKTKKGKEEEDEEIDTGEEPNKDIEPKTLNVKYTTLTEPRVIKGKDGVKVSVDLVTTRLGVVAPGDPRSESMGEVLDALKKCVPQKAKALNADQVVKKTTEETRAEAKVKEI